MPSNTELDRFVRDALLAGQSREAIRNALQQAGWSAEQLTGVLDDYADVDFPVPVPRPRASLSARDAFLYLVLFSLLYFLCYHFGSLLFDLINAAFPDPTDGSRYFDFGASTRFSTAALLITFPLFAWMARMLGRETERAPIKRFSPVRRWLTYLTLFVSAATLVGDLTALVYNVLGGELTIRFVLKVVVVGVIAGSVFGYYLRDLRREEGEVTAQHALGKRLLSVAAVLALAALAGGFLLMGSPMHQRELRMDQQRTRDLNQIEMAVRSRHAETGTLPASLDVLASQPGLGLSVQDPVSGQRYGYHVDDDTHFRLCAVFDTDTAEMRARRRLAPYDAEWAHGKGETCFTRKLQSAGQPTTPDAAAAAAPKP